MSYPSEFATTSAPDNRHFTIPVGAQNNDEDYHYNYSEN